MLNLKDLQDLLDLLPIKIIGYTISQYNWGLTCVCSGVGKMDGYTIVFEENDFVQIRDRSDMINPANHFHFSGTIGQAKEWLKERRKNARTKQNPLRQLL